MQRLLLLLLLLLSIATSGGGCPDWCAFWACDGSAWCAGGGIKPGPCTSCVGGSANCAAWCTSWTCDGDWCRGGDKPSECSGCEVTAADTSSSPGAAVGPVAGTNAGWVVEQAKDGMPTLHSEGTVTVHGDTRVYLVADHNAATWAKHQYVRFDVHAKPLEMEVDLSNVPCGCLACVYLVMMKDPVAGDSSYCASASPLTLSFPRPLLVSRRA